MSISYTNIFTDLGLFIRIYNLMITSKASIDAESVKLMAQLDDDGDDAEILRLALAANISAKSSLSSCMTAIAAVAKTYATNIIGPAIYSTATSDSGIIDDLITAMTADSESVDACTVSMLPSSIADTNDGNAQVAGYEGLTGIDSALLDDQNACKYRLYISVVDDTGGYWHVDIYSDSGRAGGALVAHTATFNASGTETLTADNSSGLGGSITVSNATGFAADTDIYVDFEFGGSRAGTGTIESWSAGQLAPDADFKAVCVSAVTAGSEVWDIYRRIDGEKAEKLSTRATTAVAYAAEGLNFTITAPTIQVENDGSTQLDSLVLTGGAKNTNCDADGRVYINLAGKEDAITEANDGNDQVAGYDGITGLVCGTNTDASGIIYISVVDDGGGDFHLNLYKDSGRSALVAHTASYSTAGEKALVEDNSSGIGGTIDVDDTTGFTADVDITVTFPFVQVSVYKEVGKSNLVAQSAWTLGTGNGAPSSTAFTLTAQNSSGLSGTVNVSYTADDGDIAAVLVINFASGDEFRWSTTTDDAGTFEKFFRDVWGKSLPSNAAGAETIADTLAE